MSPTRGDLPVASTPLLAGLARPDGYGHPVAGLRAMETHISWVILTGSYAYKIKKPVNLGFLDFTTLARRRHYCEEEVRLNRRLAPGLYLEVVEIHGTPEAPTIGGAGPLLEYAVKMRQFPQKALAGRALARGEFGAPEVDSLAAVIADFHGRAPAAASDRFGAPDTVWSAALQNFVQMLPQVKLARDRAKLRALCRWAEHEFAARRQAVAARRRAGFVRECHGDLHLGNIALLEGQPVPFDCIEFNDELRWIDVMSEVAFLFMDLMDRGRTDLGWRFINRYLELTGDYGGLAVLRFYLVYRALVRAKIHLIRARQPSLPRPEQSRLMRAFRGYLALAMRCATPDGSCVIIAHGLSGSGKTTATQTLVELQGAVRLRSDLERKRMHGLAPLAASGSELACGIYAPKATAATYRRLAELARGVAGAGYPVVVDATFLKRTEREPFRAVAEELDAPFLILSFRAPLAVLRARVIERRARADDASEADLAVLEHQIATCEPLTPAEMAAAIVVDGTRAASRRTWRPALERLRLLRRRAGRKPAASAGNAPVLDVDQSEGCAPVL